MKFLNKLLNKYIFQALLIKGGILWEYLIFYSRKYLLLILHGFQTPEKDCCFYHQPKDRSKQSRHNMQSCSIKYDVVGKSIVLTGDFEIAEVADIENKLSSMGAILKRDVSGKTDYLVIGNLGHSQWYYGSYGRKIEKAIELQKQGKPIIMIEEDDFFVWNK